MADDPLIATHTHRDIDQRGAMNTVERALSFTTGAALLFHGWRTGGLPGALEAAAGAYGVYRGAVGHCALKQALTPTPLEQQWSAEHHWPISAAITRSITINRPLDDIRTFISGPENLGPLLRWIDSVELIAPGTTRWTIRAPGGRRLHWTLIQTETAQTDKLHWKTSGTVLWEHDVTVSLTPAPAGRGTQVKAIVVCKPTMGRVGYGLARAFSMFSDKALLNALQALKQQLETGEVSTNRLRPQDDDDFFYVHGSTEQVATDHATVKTGVAIEGGIH